MAIQNSAMALASSGPIYATPPMMKSVMLRTGILVRKVTIECPNSWSSTPENTNMVVAAPTIHFRVMSQFLNSAG